MFWKAEGDGVVGVEERLTGLLRSVIKCTAPGLLDVVREGRKRMRDGVKKGKLVRMDVDGVCIGGEGGNKGRK